MGSLARQDRAKIDASDYFATESPLDVASRVSKAALDAAAPVAKQALDSTVEAVRQGIAFARKPVSLDVIEGE